MSKYLQLFLCDIRLLSDDSVFLFLFLITISTHTSINLFSNNLLSVDYFVVFGIVTKSIFSGTTRSLSRTTRHYPCGHSQISPLWNLHGNSAF